MKAELEQYIGNARWFGGKGRGHAVSGVRRVGTLGGPPTGDDPVVVIELVTLAYEESDDSEVYQVPLAFYTEAQDRLEHAYLGSWKDEDYGDVHAYDALHDRTSTALWLQAFATEQSDGDLAFHRMPGHELDLDVLSTLFSGEQSNSSVAFGEDSLMKVFRKITPGHNPDIEIHEALTTSESEHVAALYGWLECPARETPGDPRTTNARPGFRRATAARDAAAVPAHRERRLGPRARQRPRPVRRGGPARERGGR